MDVPLPRPRLGACVALPPQAGVPAVVLAATQRDELRKPHPGMWDFYVDTFMEGLEPGACRSLLCARRVPVAGRGSPPQEGSKDQQRGGLSGDSPWGLTRETGAARATRGEGALEGVGPVAMRARADMSQSFYVGDNEDGESDEGFAASTGLAYRDVQDEFG